MIPDIVFTTVVSRIGTPVTKLECHNVSLKADFTEPGWFWGSLAQTCSCGQIKAPVVAHISSLMDRHNFIITWKISWFLICAKTFFGQDMGHFKFKGTGSLARIFQVWSFLVANAWIDNSLSEANAYHKKHVLAKTQSTFLQIFLPITQYLIVNPKPQRWMPGNTKVIVLCVVILKKSYCKLSKTLWSTLKLANRRDQTKTVISIFYLTILINLKYF